MKNFKTHTFLFCAFLMSIVFSQNTFGQKHFKNPRIRVNANKIAKITESKIEKISNKKKKTIQDSTYINVNNSNIPLTVESFLNTNEFNEEFEIENNELTMISDNNIVDGNRINKSQKLLLDDNSIIQKFKSFNKLLLNKKSLFNVKNAKPRMPSFIYFGIFGFLIGGIAIVLLIVLVFNNMYAFTVFPFMLTIIWIFAGLMFALGTYIHSLIKY